MAWVPEEAWLTKLQIDTEAGDLRYDLAIDATGKGDPSPVAAGLEFPVPDTSNSDLPEVMLALLVAAGVLSVCAVAIRMRPGAAA